MPADDLAGTRDLLVQAVRQAGELALKTFQAPLKSWMKTGSSPVSEADLAVDVLLHERLCRDGIGWLSEETEDDLARMDAPSVWVIDPIDGTRGYIAGKPDWAISAALVTGGRPVLAALYAPATGEFFLATAGAGATLNGAPMAVSAGSDLKGARVSGTKRRIECLSAIEPGIEALPRIGSLALRVARVAGGTLEVAFAGPNGRDWDLAAADLILHEAGGLLTDLAGETLIYNRADPVHGALIAAGRSRHATLLAIVRDRIAEFS